MTTLCFIDTETTGLDIERHEVWEAAVILRDLAVPGTLEQELVDSLSTPVDNPDQSAASWIPYIVDFSRDQEFVWQLPVDLARADPMALNIGRFHERRDSRFDDDPPRHTNLVYATEGQAMQKSQWQIDDWCRHFAKLTWGAHMIGCVPSFDTERLARLLRANGACPGWHYQPIDVETLAAGNMIGWCRGVAKTGDITRYPGLVRGNDIARQLPWSSDELLDHYGVKVADEDRHTALGDAHAARDLWDAIHQIGERG